MASVWAAREVSPSSGKQRIVAVKVMLPELAMDPTFRSMFLNEGGITGSIQHENVVRVYEVAESDGMLYMAMEWIEGDSLQTLINVARQRRPIPPEMAVRIVADAAAGLHAAQELRGWDGELRGIVHCDVSPHNILVGPSGVAKLVDFGVASALAKKESRAEDERIGGKFGYMSPEQAMGRELDRRSDIFSLGVVLYELTTGRRLFKGRNPSHTLTLVTSGQIPLPSTLVSDYPPRLEQVVFKALERDVNRRFQTAEQMQKALEAYLVEERIMVTRAGVGQLAKRVLGDRIKQRRVALRHALDQLGGERIALPAPPDHEPLSDSATSAKAALSHTVPDPRSAPGYEAIERRRGGTIRYLALALALLVGALLSFLLFGRTPGTAIVTEGPTPAAEPAPTEQVSTAPTAVAPTPSGEPRGVAAGDLPAEPRPSAGTSSTGAPAAARPGVTPLRRAPATPPSTPARDTKKDEPKGDDSIVLEEVEEPPPPPKPPPKPETVDKCGCKVTDFACAIRCSRTGK